MQDALVEERFSYPVAVGEVDAYLARPATGGPFAAVLVIHEQHGLTGHIEACARRFANNGYLALAPDLFSPDPVWRSLRLEDLQQAQRIVGKQELETGLAQLPAESRERVRRAAQWLANRDRSTHLAYLQQAVKYLEGRADVRPDAIGAVGYCMGGGFVSELATAGLELAAGVIFYGRVHRLDLVAQIRCPLIGHYGSDDPGPTRQVPTVEAAMQANGKDYNAYIYQGAGHGFNNDTRESFAAGASELAWERTLGFLQQHLRPLPVASRWQQHQAV